MSPIVNTTTEQGITGEVISGKLSPRANETSGYIKGIANKIYDKISYLCVRSKVVYPVIVSQIQIIAITPQNIAITPL